MHLFQTHCLTGPLTTTTFNSQRFFTTTRVGGAVSVQDTTSSILLPLQGSYSVFLQGLGGGPAASVAIGQTAQLPADAASLRYWASPLSILQLSLDGQVLPVFLLGTTPGYSIFGADVSAFAGQMRELRLTGPSNGGGLFDNIQFSNQPIPEPGMISILLVGLGGFGFRVWSRAR